MNNFQEKIKGLDELINNAINDEAFPGANYCLVTTDEVTFNSLGKKALVPNVEDNNIDMREFMYNKTGDYPEEVPGVENYKKLERKVNKMEIDNRKYSLNTSPFIKIIIK